MDLTEKSKEENIKKIYDIENLKQIMNHYQSNFNESQIDIMFVKKSSSVKQKYRTYMFECSKESIKNCVIGTLGNMSDCLDRRQLDKYDLEVSIDDTIQTIEKEKVINGEEVLSKITLEYTDENTLKEGMNFDSLDFLIMQISSGEEEIPIITFIKKHLSFTSKYKDATKGMFVGREFIPINKKILTIGSNVDAVLIDDYYYITNRNNFNSMLDFKDIYHNIVEANRKDISDSNLLDNSDQFINDCKENGRYLPRLTKAILAEGFKNVKENHENLEELIVKHKLELKHNQENQLVYDKDNINEILNLLLQHYVTSDLTKKSMIAKAIEKYSA